MDGSIYVQDIKLLASRFTYTHVSQHRRWRWRDGDVGGDEWRAKKKRAAASSSCTPSSTSTAHNLDCLLLLVHMEPGEEKDARAACSASDKPERREQLASKAASRG